MAEQRNESRSYRKKPVVIEAVQWNGTMDGMYEINDTFPGLETIGFQAHGGSREVWDWRIRTLEGEHKANKGDWIIKGVKGEFYPCKPDVFALTYEPADAQSSTAPRAISPLSRSGEEIARTVQQFIEDPYWSAQKAFEIELTPADWKTIHAALTRSSEITPGLADLCKALGWQGGTIHQVVERVALQRAALQEITRGAGPFNSDPLQHANNCIEAMKGVAVGALEGTWSPE